MINRATDLLPQPMLDVLLPLGRMEPPWLYLEPTGRSGTNNLTEYEFTVRFRVSPLPTLCHTANDWLTNYLVSRWIAHGPKVARVPPEWSMLLAQIEVRLQVDDLSFPFPELLVELPPGAADPYRMVLIGRLERGEVCNYLADPTHHHDIVSTICQRKEPEWVVEDTLQQYAPDCAADAPAANRALRIALNAALLLTGNPRLTDALPVDAESDRRMARESTDRGKRARNRLQTAIQVVHFEQVTDFPVLGSQLLERERAAPGEEPTYSVSPHWRRGHWRMQAHGPKNGLRKRILVPPVLVRADRFCGDTADSFTIYRKSE